MDTSGASSAAAAVAQEAMYHYTQQDIENVFELLSGLASIEMFILVGILVQVGLTMALLFTVALRRL